jgi:cell division protein FtsB
MKNKIFVRWFNSLINMFIGISIIFIFWMCFLDSNSWLAHKELNKEIETLQSKKEFYKNQIEKDLEAKKKLETKNGSEKYAREKYYMKRKNEDVFLIESDTTKNEF